MNVHAKLQPQWKIYEAKSVKTSLNDEVVNIMLITHLIYEVLRNYPAYFKLCP